jgi:hypothetical protein
MAPFSSNRIARELVVPWSSARTYAIGSVHPSATSQSRGAVERQDAPLGLLVEFGYAINAMEDESIRFEHEQATIKAFVVPERRERVLYLLWSPKRRKKFLDELGHFRWFDRRFSTAVQWKVDPALSLWGRHQQGIQNIANLLRLRGARNTCCVISQITGVDGQELELGMALEAVVGKDMGTILSCVPGKLAYFEGEDESLLLAR